MCCILDKMLIKVKFVIFRFPVVDHYSRYVKCLWGGIRGKKKTGRESCHRD